MAFPSSEASFGTVTIEDGDDAALADAIGGLLSDRAKRERLGDAGRARAEAEFGWEGIIEQWNAPSRGLGATARMPNGERSMIADDAGRLKVLDVFSDEEGTRFEQREVISDRPDHLARLTVLPGATALMVWDVGLASPDPALVHQLLQGPCHVWHAGILLGQADRPEAWNLCHGRAMFSYDVDASRESTSWKMSLKAVIIRNEVMEALGGFDPAFDTASGAALDAGLRWIRRGALMRHVPGLAPEATAADAETPPSEVDGIRIVERHLGARWALWALVRGVRKGLIGVRSGPRALRALREPHLPLSAAVGLPVPEPAVAAPVDRSARVTVLVPTVGRYGFLEQLLVQLDGQTRRPDEVVVVDQNEETSRRDLTAIAPDLPLKVLYLRPPGQCTARNLGLRASTGTHILFLDDDDEIPADLIESHLRVLAPHEVSVSCGLIDDRESGPAPASERYRKASGILPTNNAMLRRSVLHDAGLFDPTYDRGSRADHDLGMRSYIAGNLHVHDPGPKVFHHHAPQGGLRTHGARVRTRGNSRSTLTERHLRTPTDIYLGLRYYSRERVDDDLALSVFTTLSGGGSAPRRMARVLIQLVLLPDTWKRSKAALREGQRLYRERPELPTLEAPGR